MVFHETQQTTDTVLMIRPAHFGYNPETAASNAFQHNEPGMESNDIAARALQEFDQLVLALESAGIEVLVAHDRPDVRTTDSVFPNNWVSFHEDGSVITYPMCSPQRRQERREDLLDEIGKKFRMEDRLRLERHEQENRFLEGTGSLVLDRPHRLAYACLSNRTDEDLLDEFCTFSGYEAVVFQASDKNGQPIYHTNVMMAIGETFAVVALDTIKEPQDRAKVLAHLHHTKKEVVEITMEQVYAFAGNMLQLRNKKGELFLILSQRAFDSLSEAQVSRLRAHTNLLHIPVPTIETYGGGSVRCMIAEVFLPAKPV